MVHRKGILFNFPVKTIQYIYQALLRKHWTLEHLLASIGESEVLVKSVWGGWRGVKREVGFVRQLQTVEEKQKIGGFTEELQQSLKT